MPLRIETYGTIDELSSAIGIARCSTLRADIGPDDAPASPNVLDAWLAWTQDVSCSTSAAILPRFPADRWEGMPLVTAGDATALERAIDRSAAQISNR